MGGGGGGRYARHLIHACESIVVCVHTLLSKDMNGSA